MKTLLSTLLLIFICHSLFSQTVYQIRADSVRIYNTCDTAELILENRTQKVPGFLFNKGQGRTEFRQLQLNMSGNALSIPGQDTVDLGLWGDSRYDLAGSNYKTIPNGTAVPFAQWPMNKVVGYGIYSGIDMPTLSDQAFQSRGTTLYYNGLMVGNGTTGFDMAVNWDGELLGPNGVFFRIKDDTKTAWSNWRELLFKDYAETHFQSKEVIKIKEGASDARMGVIDLADGEYTATVNTTALTANSRIFLTPQSGQGAIGSGPASLYVLIVNVSSSTPGESFTITSNRNRTGLGPAKIAWMIVEAM